MATAKARIDLERSSMASGETTARWAMYIALGAAWVATCGSLYMSEALGWLPCPLCWYQRILMYPSAIVMAIGLINRDRHTPKYSLVLTAIGACVSINHIAEQKIPGFAILQPCSGAVSCATDPLNAFGWLTIPMLALAAFVVIIIGSIIVLRVNANGTNVLTDAPTSIFSPVPSVLLVVLMIVGLFGVTGWITRSRRLADLYALSQPTLPGQPVSQERAAQIYAASCQQCHGPANAGMQLIRTQYLKDNSDITVIAMIRAGRAATALDNVSHQAMPANGGRLSMSDDELLALVKYLRQAKGL